MGNETFSTSSRNTYTVLGVEELEKIDVPEMDFTKYEKEESFPVYLKYVLIEETVFVELKKRLVETRLFSFFHSLQIIDEFQLLEEALDYRKLQKIFSEQIYYRKASDLPKFPAEPGRRDAWCSVVRSQLKNSTSIVQMVMKLSLPIVRS